MPTLDGYILKEFMIPLTVLLVGFILLFVIGDIFNDLKDFIEADVKAPISVIVKYFLLLLPGNIRFILPISSLLACMYTMAHFGKNMEVTAMRASGISLFRCGMSIYFVGLVMTGLNFWFNERFVPFCEREAHVLKKKTTNKDYVVEFQNMLSFRSSDKKRTWLFKYFEANGVQKDVILKNYRADGVLDWELEAHKAFHQDGKGWVFKNATVTPFLDRGLMPGQPEKFAEYVKTQEEIPETPWHIMNAVKEPEELPIWTIWAIINETRDMAKNCEAVYWTILFYRLAFPWACLIAVFLGIPLAANNERGGIFKSIITAIVVIVIYQLSSHIFIILGKQGYLPPAVAGLLPTVAFLAFGIHQITRKT
jgi:lipopolysaccharide export system permease protein